MGVQIIITALEICEEFLIKLNITLFCGPAIPMLGVYPRERKTKVQKKDSQTDVHIGFIHTRILVTHTTVETLIKVTCQGLQMDDCIVEAAVEFISWVPTNISLAPVL